LKKFFFFIKFQFTIQIFQTLCEKGLSAMESSHKRIISDLEVKHKSEIQRLLNEKETALAEETQVSRKSFYFQSTCTRKDFVSFRQLFKLSSQ
jgi:hypothetical protein